MIDAEVLAATTPYPLPSFYSHIAPFLLSCNNLTGHVKPTPNSPRLTSDENEPRSASDPPLAELKQLQGRLVPLKTRQELRAEQEIDTSTSLTYQPYPYLPTVQEFSYFPQTWICFWANNASLL